MQRCRSIPSDGAGFLQLHQREFFFGALQLALFRNNLRRECVETEAAFTLVPLQISDAIFVASCFDPHFLHLLVRRHLSEKISRSLLERDCFCCGCIGQQLRRIARRSAGVRLLS
jgi:hypothetical protein